MTTEQLRPEVQALAPDLVAWRRYLHTHPELSFAEHETAAYIAKHLDSLGIQRLPAPGTSVIGLVEGDRPGKTVAIRADIDALPIHEENRFDFASTRPGVMHACGHDGHTAILMGVARYLAQHRDFPGRVKLLFQSAEEVPPGGAQQLVKAGALDDVDQVIGLHLMSDIPLGQAGIVAGPMMANSDGFTCVIRGKGGHGASPHQTIDAIVVASQALVGLQTIVSRHVDPLDPAVISVGTIQGGFTYNVIAPEVRFTGTVRTFSSSVQDQVQHDMERIIAATCQMHGAAYEFTYNRDFPVLVNHPHETAVMAEAARAVLGLDQLRDQRPQMGGEDFAYYLQKRPGAYLFLGCRNEAVDACYPHHHPRFTIDESALPSGVQILLSAADALLHEGS